LRLIVLTGLIFIFTGVSTAQAELAVVFKKSDSVQTTKKKIKVNLKHVAYICNEGTGKPKAEHCRATRWLKRWYAKLSTPVLSVPHYSAWLCIHGHEGSWTDSGDPYWGGLQMDKGFMSTYAPRWLLAKGWADNWTPIEQMYVAERAYSSGRGFGPWPNTARMCGLL
jgi:hypothetical protein